MSKTLSISIVTYNNISEIQKLLQPIINLSDLDIYIIDNHSTDGTVDIIKKMYSNLNILINEENLGFGAAHNKVIDKLTSQYHIFVNPDIVVSDKTLLDVIQFMNTYKDVAAMSPKVMNFDDTEQYLPKKSPTIRFMLGGRLEQIHPFFSAWRNQYTLKNQNITNVKDVDFCTGCFFVTRTDYIKKAGGFDERFFLYFEDADLTRRLKKFGRTVYNPQIQVLHGSAKVQNHLRCL